MQVALEASAPADWLSPLPLRHYGARLRGFGVLMVEWSGTPAYRQVAEKLRERIAAGEFAATGKLPSLSQLEVEYGASVTVVREAVRQLSSDGLVVRHQGKGAFLTSEAAALAGQPSPSGEVGQLREELADVRAELREIRERLARLERT